MISQERQHRASKGAALMAVLWLIAILALACMSALRVISFDMELASAKVHGSRARQVAEMGIAVGSHNMVKRSDPMLRRFNEETGEGYEVKVTSEGGRFNINYVVTKEDKALLRNLFVDWGLELEDAQDIADALADWVDADDDESLNGAEKNYYEGEGRINQPFNRPFYDLSEVSLVRGMNLVEAVRPDWRNFFCVWSGGPLDLNDAPAELIAAAAEVPVDQADLIPEAVRGTDGIRDTTDDAPFQDAATALDLLGIDVDGRPDLAQRFTVNDTTTRIESIGHAEGAKRKITVIVANRTGRPALLERTEEIIP
ncbi:MAG: hypothetical protein EOP88_12710 [Verrucomicrobiaceae bacterium]|nr:MAG: hypothetical protein EOP88_12710 [Verrucomicrobiaceae bacterium]